MAKRQFDSNRNEIGGARRANVSSDRYAYSEMRFVNIELSEAEKQEFRSLLVANEFPPYFLDCCLKGG